jgi:hypothetical protein
VTQALDQAQGLELLQVICELIFREDPGQFSDIAPAIDQDQQLPRSAGQGAARGRQRLDAALRLSVDMQGAS